MSSARCRSSSVVRSLDVTLSDSVRLLQIQCGSFYCLGFQNTGDLCQPDRGVFREGRHVGLRELLPTAGSWEKFPEADVSTFSEDPTIWLTEVASILKS